MSYIANAALNPSNQANRVEDVETLNEKKSPENYTLVGDGTSSQSYIKYFQVGNLPELVLHYSVTLAAASSGDFSLSISASYETGEDEDLLDYVDVLYALEHVPNGSIPEQISQLSYDMVVHGAGTYSGLIRDPDGVLNGASYIKLTITMEDDENLTIFKNARAI